MVCWHVRSSCNAHYISIAAMVDTFNPPETQLLVLRYPHVVPVDPSLASLLVRQRDLLGYISIAMLTLVFYNAC